jgi:TRAP transporter TAXI family solute receptor
MLRTLIVLILLLLVGLIWLNVDRAPEKIRLAGGPEGGTFIVYTKGLANLLQQENPEWQIKVNNSAGSVANLKAINAGKVSLALVYAADAYLGSQGLLNNLPARLTNVQALGRVYGSTAQLVVLKDSIIETPEDLVNRRVAIGSPGSGAAHSAERYFRILQIWDEIIPLHMGYDLAMEELINRRAQAVWQLVGAPSASIVNTNRTHPLRLIDLSELANQSDFLLEYPFYSRVRIPADTYRGQPQPIDSFQDNTLLVTHPDTDPELITAALQLLFSPKGMRQMRKVHPIGKDLDLQKGLQGIQIPLHPEAENFWRERGVLK